ncbi:hypothetical protein BU25DRAFT_452359 [Macroventuria anomochaeta]|uniref:Uncharacterized protein n=1 Tax=Macroventuria anomochaeta TaxID=301207 RepID=A0ACB6RLW4_9PLEO|nr:uncharacterized protein BU25DRAFT_452359 [Macroventuria anomochaeta]KAF2621952.1 hypothetical protein BU25DRAFT_452359 [Macroventuria anomochaeta]
MSFSTSFDFTNTRCYMCSYARSQGERTCSVCLGAARLDNNNFSKPTNISPRREPRYIRASMLWLIMERYGSNITALKMALEAAVKTMDNDKMLPMKPDNPAVMLAKGDFGKNVPAIWLEPAEGAAPTMDFCSWTNLECPTWGGNEVYVCMEKGFERSVHIRSGECEKCVLGVWMNAGARLMLGGWTELEERRLDWEDDCDWKTGEQKKRGVKRAFRTFRKSFRKCFRSRDPRQKLIWD